MNPVKDKLTSSELVQNEASDKAKKLFAYMESRADSSRFKGIIADQVLNDFNARNTVTVENFDTFMDKCPTPESFNTAMESLLQRIEAENGPKKRKQYEEVVNILKRMIFTESVLWDKRSRDEFDKAKKREEEPQTILEQIGPIEAQRILDRTKFVGADYKGKNLDKEFLSEKGLEPRYKTQLGENFSVAFSVPYEASLRYYEDIDDYSKRKAVVAYIEKDNQTEAHTFYLSDSHAIWRLLPYYEVNEDRGLRKMGKGHDQDSINLVGSIQKSLAELSAKEPTKVLDAEDSQLAFAGPATKIDFGAPMAEYFEPEFVDEDGETLLADFEPGRRGEFRPPESIQFKDPENKPDFSKMIDSWTQDTKLYGQVTTEIFASKNGKLHYHFNKVESPKLKVWISGIEKVGESNKLGITKEWIDAEELGISAYSYYNVLYELDETGVIYGDKEDEVDHYRDMTQNYTHKVPIIAEYIRLRT